MTIRQATFKKMAVKNDRETKKPELKVIKPEVPMLPEPETATQDKQLTLFDLLASQKKETEGNGR